MIREHPDSFILNKINWNSHFCVSCLNFKTSGGFAIVHQFLAQFASSTSETQRLGCVRFHGKSPIHPSRLAGMCSLPSSTHEAAGAWCPGEQMPHDSAGALSMALSEDLTQRKRQRGSVSHVAKWAPFYVRPTLSVAWPATALCRFKRQLK